MTISIDTLFYTQVGSILAFLIMPFVLYRLLVRQKDATIEQLNEQCNTYKVKNEALSQQRPDILVIEMTHRIEALENQLKYAVQQKNVDNTRIASLTTELSADKQQLEALSQSINIAQVRITKYKRTSMRAALATLYSDRCQICGTSSKTLPQACSIRPLSDKGTQTLSNHLQLCPNHHHQFDAGTFTVSDDCKLIGIPGTLELDSSHKLDLDSLHFHQQQIHNA
jgi:predicted restriction endonuclease